MHDQSGGYYLALRLLHIVGSMIFLGGLFLSVLVKLHADRSNDPSYAATLHRALRRADNIIVGPAAIATFVGGYAMIRFLGGRIAQHWFAVWGLILLFASLAFWYFGIRRLNDRLAAEAEACHATGKNLSKEYATSSVAWLLFQALAIGSLLAAAVVMVFRVPLGIA